MGLVCRAKPLKFNWDATINYEVCLYSGIIVANSKLTNNKTMKKLLPLVAFFIAISTSAQTTITKKLGDFSSVKVFNGINVELIKGSEQEIVITGEKAEKVKVKNNNGKLRISLKLFEIGGDDKVSVKVYYTDKLDVIDGNEGCTITGKIPEQTYLEIKSQEKAYVDLEIKTKHLKIKSSSGGIIKLKGNSKNQEVDLDLYGVYHGYDLVVSENTTLRVGSGAKAEVQAGETLNAKVTFGGSIFYKGNPEVIKDKKVIGGIIKQVD